MLLHVDNITKEGLTLEFSEPASSFPVLADMQQRNEVLFAGVIQIHLKISMLDGMVSVSGVVQADVVFHCSRCLVEYATPIQSAFDLTYVKELPEVEGDDEEIEVAPEDMGLMLYSGDTIDLREAVQQEVIMALPLRPLCKADCKGLCLKCGGNLNQEVCHCDTDDFSLKFSALKNFKVDEKR
ncbi:DUF177 domain-containing protein [Desulfuromonas sp. AOP6]|uniref:YceD family protein n=1 Tax=Desulfuromonas sp. AOP6 TaxID=1566351 RepID=UPI001276D45C|nr:DUF177 domain-containing protein [Desulfuromonas sp. AOP6]BCA79820.1 hypothetical protein AOP6_1607 [Desulfuromonas sp. AOP6]